MISGQTHTKQLHNDFELLKLDLEGVDVFSIGALFDSGSNLRHTLINLVASILRNPHLTANICWQNATHVADPLPELEPFFGVCVLWYLGSASASFERLSMRGCYRIRRRLDFVVCPEQLFATDSHLFTSYNLKDSRKEEQRTDRREDNYSYNPGGLDNHHHYLIVNRKDWIQILNLVRPKLNYLFVHIYTHPPPINHVLFLHFWFIYYSFCLMSSFTSPLG